LKNIKVKTIQGPFGPHHAKKMFKVNNTGKWHFLKWISEKQYKKEKTNAKTNTTRSKRIVRTIVSGD
jgi:hypothetical protein